MPSGRVRIDVAETLDSLREPVQPPSTSPMDASILDPPAVATLAEAVAAAAIRAPSGGNSQPWHVDIGADSVSLRLAPEHSSTMDVGFRGSAVALGAAVFNARVAAAAHGALGPVELVEHTAGSPLQAVVWLGDGSDANLAHQYEPMLRRETNRRRGMPKQVPSATIQAMTQAAESEGSRLALLTTSEQIAQAATIIGEADRIRYLTSQLHLEMVSELRWPGDQPSSTGIDVRSLELSPSELATLDILRRRDVMAWVARWGGGRVLADTTRALMATSSALAVVSVEGQSLTDYARGGSAVEAVWITAQSRGLSVHPVSPAFLYAASRDEFDKLSPAFAMDLCRLQVAFRQLFGTAPQESHALVLRLSDSPAASLRSRRRPNRGQ